MKNSILAYISAALILAAAGCTADFAEPTYSVDADGRFVFNVEVSIPDALSLSTRGVIDNTPNNPDGGYLQGMNFYMFVFEDNGSPQANYLRELVYGRDIVPVDDSATADSPMIGETDEEHRYKDDTGKGLVRFKVHLDGTAENAIIHLVATKDSENFEKNLQDVPDRSEFGIFAGATGLYTTQGEAYWRRIELNCPINKDNASGIQSQLSHLNMVRNFSRVTLKVDPEGSLMGFVVDGFVIVNAIGSGYVAAYNENLGANGEPGFVEFGKTEEKSAMREYWDLVDNEHYVPARHPVSERVNGDDDTSWFGDFETNANNDPKFTFERSVQDEHKTYVVLKGHYDKTANPYGVDGPRYVKLDIGTRDMYHIDPDTEGTENPEPFGVFVNYHLIRNISYDITIKSVGSNSLGSGTIGGALTSPPSNNISTSVETRPLTTIYDGVDKLQVEYTTLVIVDDDEGNPVPQTKELKWRYTENYQSTPENYISNSVKWNFPGYSFAFDGGVDPDGIIASWDGRTANESTLTPKYNSDINTTDAKDYGNGWMGFNLHFNKPDDIVRQKTLRLYNPQGLTRDVTFILHNRWEFVDSRPDLEECNIEVYPGAYSYENGTMPFETLEEMRNYFLGYSNYQDQRDISFVGSQRGAQLTVMFELPTGLPEAIFPLEFKIGTDRQNIENAYVGNAVVVWGDSMFEDQEDPSFGHLARRMQFIKTVNWKYYNGDPDDKTNPNGHKIVCARFMTLTDALVEMDNNTSIDEPIARTRVRVTNPYFKLGQDTFERSAHDDVIDPTRTRWYWNFSYPEWTTYFSNYADCATNPTGWPDISVDNEESNPHNLNNLNFAGYVHGTKDDYTNVSGIFMQPKADASGVTRSADNPEFQFNLQGSSETGMTATMTIEATPNRDRNYRGAVYKYDFYFREVFVKLITKDHPEGLILSRNCDSREGTYTSTLNRYRLEMNTLTYTFDIAPGDVVENVLIWSVKRTGPSKSGANYSYQNGETRYYSIEFTLNPK